MRLFRIKTLLLLAAVGSAGIWLGGHPAKLPEPVRDALVDQRATLGTEVIDTVEGSFYRPVERRKLENGSIEGIVRVLDDRFSHYFAPGIFKRFRQSIESQYSGVGLTVNEVKRGLRVLHIFKGTPAQRAGIRPGDLILAVNGRSIAGLASEVSTARIKGPEGTSVRLTLLRPPSKHKRRLNLKRAQVKVPAVAGRLRKLAGHRLGHVVLAGFSDGAHGELRKQVQRLYKRGAEGIVLDLRRNGGGLLDEAVLVASIFIEDGVIVSTEGRSRPRRVFTALGDALPRKPMVVLVDRDSASASEIVAAALAERDRATLVGQRTYGKGSFQEVLDLPNGAGLNLTVGEYRTPGGHRLVGKGIKPKIHAVDRPRTRRDEGAGGAMKALVGLIEKREQAR